MSASRGLRMLLAALVLGAMGAFCALRLEVTTDVTEFLATGGDRELAQLSRRLAGSELNRTLILSVDGPTSALALAGAGEVAEALRDHPEVAWVQTGPDPEAGRAFHDLVHPRRLLFLSDRPELELPARLSDAGLREAAAALKHQLSLPTATLVKRLAPGDPLLATWRQLQRMEAARAGGLRVEDGRYLAPDGQAIVFLASRRSAFDTDAQRALVTALEEAFAAATARAGGVLTHEWTGVNKVALASEASTRADVTRISVVSTVGIVLLFLLLFRSPAFLLLGLLPLGAGVLTGLTASLLAFGEVHGLTLAFGSSLIGVCIDYPVHLFNHHVLERAPGEAPTDGRAALRRVWPGLLLGALTTIVGFGGLIVTSFPGIREIALFGVTGILGALWTTRLVVAPLLPSRAPTRLQAWLAARLERLLGALQRRRAATGLVLVAAAALCAAGLPRLTFVDDPKALYQEDPALAAERERLREQVSRVDGARFVVASGRDAEQALARNDRAFRRLEDARAAGALDDFRSLHTFLWSAALQRENARQLEAAPELADRMERALAAEGFRPAAFKAFRQALEGPRPEPLSIADLLASPLAGVVRPFVVQTPDGVVVLTYLRGVRDPAALEGALAGLEGVRYLDQNRFLRDVYRGYRTEVLNLIALGLGGVLLLIALRYRALRPTAAAFLPALLAGVSTLAVLALMGERIHLLHVTALLLVLSIGADYGIFLAETRRHGGGAGATLLSIALACLTTILGFGLLALSEQPVLRAIGLTCWVGVTLSLLLAPAALVIAAPPAPDAGAPEPARPHPEDGDARASVEPADHGAASENPPRAGAEGA